MPSLSLLDGVFGLIARGLRQDALDQRHGFRGIESDRFVDRRIFEHVAIGVGQQVDVTEALDGVGFIGIAAIVDPFRALIIYVQIADGGAPIGVDGGLHVHFGFLLQMAPEKEADGG